MIQLKSIVWISWLLYIMSVYFAVKQRKVVNLHIVEAGIRENVSLFLENGNNLMVEITVEAFSSTGEVLNCVCVCPLVCCLRITWELLTGFPPNLDGGCVSTQNRPVHFWCRSGQKDRSRNNVIFYFLLFFIPIPKQSTSTALWPEKSRELHLKKCNCKNLKKPWVWTYLCSADVYSGDWVDLDGKNQAYWGDRYLSSELKGTVGHRQRYAFYWLPVL